MEKQMNFFDIDTEENEYLAIWQHLPEQNRHEFETMFAQMLVKYLSSFLEEGKNYEHNEP